MLVGVAIGALIHNFIPQAFVEELLGAEHWYSVPLATLIGIPMYADIFGTIPIAESPVSYTHLEAEVENRPCSNFLCIFGRYSRAEWKFQM